MPISSERMNQYIRDAISVLEGKGDTDAEGAPLREALTITDEMVERGAVALFRASTDEDWETGPDESERDEWRAQARVALEAAMGVQK